MFVVRLLSEFLEEAGLSCLLVDILSIHHPFVIVKEDNLSIFPRQSRKGL